LLGPIRV